MYDYLEYELEEAGKWITFANDYFAVALLLAKEIIEPKYKLNIETSETKFYSHGEKINVYPEFSPDRLYFPLLFNFKHGIEVALKALIKILNVENNVKQDGHNITQVFKSLKKFIEKNKLLNFYEEYKLKSDESDFFIEFVLTETDLQEKLDFLKNLVIKYQKCEVILPYLEKNFTISDKMNDAFRYPENSLNIQLDYGEIKFKIKNESGFELQEDIVKVKNIFGSLGELFSFWSKNQKTLFKSS